MSSRLGGGHERKGSRSSSRQGFVSPTVMAASLRSVLSHMSSEELSRYKAAFQSYDADEDGYLNLAQALEALQACGVQVSSGSMLDNLDEIEVAQEDDLEATPWEMEQNRRRRRRRRNSLEQIEQADKFSASQHGGHGTGQPAHKDDPTEEQAREHERVARLSENPPALTRAISLENAPHGSSLKSPTIDISTFLNLARAPPSTATPSRTASTLMTRQASLQSNTIPPHPSYAQVASRSLSSHTQPSKSSGGTPPEWERAGYQAASNAQSQQQQSRPYTNIATGATTERASSGGETVEKSRPSLRLRDHQQTLHSLAVPSVLTQAASRRNLTGGAGDDLDDDFDFDPELDLLEAFHTFDPNKTGIMSCKNLIAIMMNMGEKWSEEEALEMAEEVDQKREGRFNYHELVKKVNGANDTHLSACSM